MLSDLIRELEEKRSSRAITYVTSDRQPPFAAKMALDVMRPLYDHLTRIGKVNQIDLVIFSQGGDTILPWKLVNLVREFTQRFCVLIPYKAHSAATLLSLGADEIVMGPMGELSPIDPSVGTPFNPPNPDNPAEIKLEIAVEDVIGFFNLAKERMGLTNQDALIRVFEKLSERIHPLAIGGVYRTHALIRSLATKMLSLHMKDKHESQRIPKIVDDLAEKLYFHNYLISRTEAQDLGLKVQVSSQEVEKIMWDIYLHFEREMGLGKSFNPLEVTKGSASGELDMSVALVESLGLRSHFNKKIRVSQAVQAKSGPVQFAIEEFASGWTTNELKESQ